VFQWVQPYLRDDQREPLKQMLERARLQAAHPEAAPTTTLTEVKATSVSQTSGAWTYVVAFALVLVGVGFVRGRVSR
jgi:hypothetical protein